MDGEPPRPEVHELASAADRLDALAETAELMGDDTGADRFRAQASDCRLRAMSILDSRD